MSQEQSFWSRVKIVGPDECWEWQGRLSAGYGKLPFNWINKGRKAHRYSYWLANGDFDLSKEVLHKCDNPPCVNPNHLFLGTHQENMIDMVNKKRNNNGESVKTHCPRGHKYNEENTHITKNGWRNCRTCDKIRQREYRKLRKLNVR